MPTAPLQNASVVWVQKPNIGRTTWDVLVRRTNDNATDTSDVNGDVSVTDVPTLKEFGLIVHDGPLANPNIVDPLTDRIIGGSWDAEGNLTYQQLSTDGEVADFGTIQVYTNIAISVSGDYFANDFRGAPTYPGQIVYLLQWNGTNYDILDETITDENGEYSFSSFGIVPGDLITTASPVYGFDASGGTMTLSDMRGFHDYEIDGNIDHIIGLVPKSYALRRIFTTTPLHLNDQSTIWFRFGSGFGTYWQSVVECMIFIPPNEVTATDAYVYLIENRRAASNDTLQFTALEGAQSTPTDLRDTFTPVNQFRFMWEIGQDATVFNNDTIYPNFNNNFFNSDAYGNPVFDTNQQQYLADFIRTYLDVSAFETANPGVTISGKTLNIVFATSEATFGLTAVHSDIINSFDFSGATQYTFSNGTL